MARGKFYNTNQYIRAVEVRVIDQTGKQIGVLAIAEALKKAQSAGLDLVEVATRVKPPVCKIVDFKKFLFAEKKKREASGETKSQRRRKRCPDLKQIKLSLFIEDHDFQRSLKRAEKFLAGGDRVRFNIFLRGRQITRKEFGYQLLQKVQDGLAAIAEVSQPPDLKGNLLMMVFKPKPTRGGLASGQT